MHLAQNKGEMTFIRKQQKMKIKDKSDKPKLEMASSDDQNGIGEKLKEIVISSDSID